MSKESATPPPSGGQFLVYQTEDGKLKIDVRFEGESLESRLAGTVAESATVQTRKPVP